MITVQKPGFIARILITLTTVTLVILGFFFLTVALAVGAVVALVIGVRFWWTLRKLKRMQGDVQHTLRTGGDTVVDGEYRVIEGESSVTRLPQNGDPASPPDAKNTPPAP